MTPDELSELIAHALVALADRGQVGLGADLLSSRVRVERPKDKAHGDYATNVALQLAKRAGMPPRALAELLAAELESAGGIASVDVAGPGFVNIRLAAEAQGQVAAGIVAADASYGDSTRLHPSRVNVEFVSANPTGPVTLASARWAAVGDAIGRLLTTSGATVTREYYFNDAGAQIERFATSLQAAAAGEPTPPDGYAGDYVADIAAAVVAAEPKVKEMPADQAQEIFRRRGVELMWDEIKSSLHDFGVDFDVYFSERSLHERGEVDAAVARLRSGGLTYEADGALWLRTTEYGDDKDRVIVRSDGRPTYICSDAAYYLDKRQRGFDKVMIILGADHHGYVGRYRAIAAAFGDNPDENLEIVIGQMVNLLRDGQPLRMSKRAGTVLTLADLVDAIGVDGARYALVRYSTDSTIDIDLDLWARASNDNPVYYVQYAHARLSSILRNAADLGIRSTVDGADPSLLGHEREGHLLRALADFPRIVASASDLREPHRVARYLEDTASLFHKFYDSCRVLPLGDEEPAPIHHARLLLVDATRIVFAKGLGLLGVTAPDRM